MHTSPAARAAHQERLRLARLWMVPTVSDTNKSRGTRDGLVPLSSQIAERGAAVAESLSNSPPTTPCQTRVMGDVLLGLVPVVAGADVYRQGWIEGVCAAHLLAD